MFEKEAIRHAFEATIGIECLNKPVDDFIYEELSDEQQEKAFDFKKGAEFGYNKANEWHKADVPTTPINKIVLGYIKDYNSKKFCLVKWNGEWWYDARTWNDKVKLIAWKEIVLPKESE